MALSRSEVNAPGSSTIDTHFTPAEVARLEKGLPRLESWSTALLTPFAVHRLIAPRMLWLNRRWFLERGLDIDNKHDQRRVSTWLLSDFGWVSKGDGVGTETNIRFADRYGSIDGLAAHG